MASMDAATLEFFVADSFMNITPEQGRAIVVILEPERAWVEYRLGEDYDPAEHSWRDYRNSMWYSLERYQVAIKAVTGDP